MEKAAAAGKTTGTGWEMPHARHAAAALAVCVLAPAAWAQDLGQGSADLIAREARKPSPVRVQVDATALPRLEAQDTGFQAPRLDVSLLDRRSGFGPMVGMSGFSSRAGLQPANPAANRPGVDLGLRWSHRLESAGRIDISAWRRMTADEDAYTLIQHQQPVYGARVEMKLSGGRSPLAFERGFVGMQLESGAKISIKRRYGGPMLYYRSTF